MRINISGTSFNKQLRFVGLIQTQTNKYIPQYIVDEKQITKRTRIKHREGI